VIRIDQNFEVVVQVLTHVAAQFRRHNARGFSIATTDAEINSVSRLENAHFRLPGGRLVLEWLSLAKLRDGLGIEPEGIVQGTVEFWSMVDGYGFGYARFGLESLGRSRGTRLRGARRRRA
jgi:hypothetical protein